MILNDFLQIKLGVEFEDKYNALAVKEILTNREKYPLIAPTVADMVQDEEDIGNGWDFESCFFDCDDEEYCANYDETMELYRAFVTAFAADVKDRPFAVKYASFGLDYLEQPNTHNVLDPHFHYLGMAYVSVFPKRTELGQEFCYPAVPGKVALGTVSNAQSNRTFASDNEEALKKVAKGFRELCESGNLFSNRFDNAGLSEHPVKLDCGETGYPCDCYEIRIGKNLLRFFSTERGFDALSVLRFPILADLTEEQRENDVVKRIEEIC
ncbi:MAG: hypothetical protein KBS45_05690 [Clostridiales bacterium]|nr:hypothetical protein [Candidatus Coliplasma caballi]